MLLVQLKNIRRKLLYLWVGFSIPILLLVFVQTISGKFEGIVGAAWAWVAINLLPILILLFMGAVQNKHGNKVIQQFIYRIMLIFSVIYLLLLLITQLGLSAGLGDQSIYEYFMQSYKWLVPFQLILLLVFAALFYRKQAVFQPNEKIIENHFKEKAKTAKEQRNSIQEEAYEMASKRDFDGIFDLLKKHSKNDKDDFYKEVILQQGRYNDWKEKTELGTMDARDAQLIINQISMALVDLIDEL